MRIGRLAPSVAPSLVVVLTASAAAGALACSRKEPPMPSLDGAVAPLPAPAATSGTSPVASASTAANAGAVASAGASTAANAGAVASANDAPSAVPSAAPSSDPGALPQTRDRPPASSPALTARATALWDAIVKDDPDLAMPFFFPVTAYEQVKAIPNPAADWRARLVSAYKRDIHAMHKKLGPRPESLKFTRLDVPDARARWVEPNEEYNALGYWRVFGSHIVYAEGGKEQSLDITSLISWRGEWYVVHLTGFK